MRKYWQGAILMLALLGTTVQVQAQKYGHLNLGNLLEEMPARKEADEKLKNFSEETMSGVEERIVKFEKEVNEFQQKMAEGSLTRVQAEERQRELQNEQQFLQELDQKARNSVAEQRKLLLEPILMDVDKAIKAVGRENGFTMIFDTSVINGVLFAEESVDVTDLVKAKLGME